MTNDVGRALLMFAAIGIVAMIVFALLPTAAWGASDWGGTSWQDHADSMDCTQIAEGATADDNYGISTVAIIKEGGDDIVLLLKIPSGITPDTTAGWTDDSAMIHVFWTSGSPTALDTLTVYAYVMNRDWGEGTKDAAPAGAGECSWNAAQEGTQDWTTAGASHADDRNPTIVDSFTVYGEDVVATDEFTITVPGEYVTSDFYNYGVGLFWGTVNAGTWSSMRFDSDEEGTAALRPYIEGWRSASSTKPKRKRKGN